MNGRVIWLNNNVKFFHCLFPLLPVGILKRYYSIVLKFLVQTTLGLCSHNNSFLIIGCIFIYDSSNQLTDKFFFFAMLIPFFNLTAKYLNIINKDEVIG